MNFKKDRYALGVDLGGTKTSFGIMGMNGNFIHLERHPTPVDILKKIDDSLLFHIANVIEKYSNLKIEGIGLGTGGVVDPKTGTIIHSTPLLPNWQGTPIKKILEEKFKIRANVDNDGNMSALGEYLFGSGKGTQNLVFIAIGTGIGGGAIQDGRIFKGSRGAAWNLGHICVEKNGLPCNCGKKGCFEAYSSGRAIETTYANKIHHISKKDPSSLPNAREIFQLLKKDDPLAKNIIETALDYLSIGITNIIELFDPDVIILGGGVIESLTPMIHDLRSRISSSTGLFNTEKIMISTLGSKAPLIGAAGSILFE